MDVFTNRSLLEEDPYKAAFLMAGYFEMDSGWVKRIGIQYVIIKKCKHEEDSKIEEWVHSFYFPGKDKKLLCWNSINLGINDTDSIEILKSILYSENDNSRFYAGEPII